MPDTSKPQDATPTTAEVAAQVDAAVRQGAEAAQRGGRAAADVVRQSSDATADVARRGAQAGAETLRWAGDAAGETVRRGAQAVAEGQRRIAEDAAHTFAEASRRVAEAARGTAEEVRRLLVLPGAAEGGLRDFQRGVTGLFEGVVQTNLRATQELLRLADPAAVVELQQRFAREYLDALAEGQAAILRAVRRTADEALRPLEAQAERTRREQGGYRQAAE